MPAEKAGADLLFDERVVAGELGNFIGLSIGRAPEAIGAAVAGVGEPQGGAEVRRVVSGSICIHPTHPRPFGRVWMGHPIIRSCSRVFKQGGDEGGGHAAQSAHLCARWNTALLAAVMAWWR